MSSALEAILKKKYGDNVRIEGDQLFVASNAVSKFADLVLAFEPALNNYDLDPVFVETPLKRNIQVPLEAHLLEQALRYFLRSNNF